MEWLKGKKTYIVAGLGGIVLGLQLAGLISAEMAATAYTALGIGGAVTLRAAISGE